MNVLKIVGIVFVGSILGVFIHSYLLSNGTVQS